MIDKLDAYANKAEDYARYRPDYSTEAISMLIKLTGLEQDWVIADIGSGTGNVAKHLVGHVRKIFAVEPNREMRQQAELSLAHHASFQSINGTAEETGLADNSVDLITVGQAAHWFDAEKTKREFHRILKAKGWLAFIWNNFDAGNLPDVENYFGDTGFTHKTFPMSIKETCEEFIGGARSAADAPNITNPQYRDFEQSKRAIFAAQAQDDLIKIDYTTELILGQLTG